VNVVLTKDAQRDLMGIHEFIAADNPTAADRVTGHLVAVFEQLADGEIQGPEVRLIDGRRVRSWPVPPYRIHYRRTSRRTVIVRVYHQARRPLEHT
jgi:toxin ParE1/3/4